MIVDIEGDSKEYNDAYKYLVTSFPCDLHLHSAFCLTAFEKTLRMLRYDAYRVIDEKISVTQDVNRIAYYKDEVIEGVAIRASFDEFYDLIFLSCLVHVYVKHTIYKTYQEDNPHCS